jgi:tetratricopeptide (TPR) repeat protein
MLTDGRHGAAPVLLFASRSGRPRFDTFDAYLRFAPRYEATVDNLEHNDYISHGVVGKTLRLGAEKAAGVRRSYDRVCLHVLHFLDAYVKHAAVGLESLERSARGEGLDEEFALRYRPPHPLPPTGRQIVALLDRDGPAKTRDLLRTMEGDMDRDALLLAGRSLYDAHRGEDALVVFGWATEIYPQSAQVLRALGDLLRADRAQAKAREAYERALALVPVDPDLTEPERVDARGEIQDALDELGKEQ